MSLRKIIIQDLVSIAQNRGNGQGVNREAFGLIYVYMIDPLTKHILKIVRNEDTAKDLASEVFIRVYQNIPWYNENKSLFSTWVFGIGRNLAIDYLRGNKRRTGSYTKDKMQLIEDCNVPCRKSDNTNYEVERKELSKAIGLAMEALPAKYRQATESVLLDELSYADAAKAMEIPIGTVKSSVFRGRKHLRNSLREHYSP